jgi:phage tail-like protein
MEEHSLVKPRVENFLYLNRDNRWLGFHRRGLEIRRDGALQLCSVPLFEGESPAPAEVSGPAGIAQDVDGVIYLSDPLKHSLFRIGCDEALMMVPCLGGEGSIPGQLKTPRGLFIPKHRSALFVVDSENHRVQVFDLASGQLVEVLGQASVIRAPEPSHEPGGFNTPWTLTGDEAGNLYIVDYGNRRVQKFNRIGEVVPGFWNAIANAQFLRRPSDVAAYSGSDKTSVYLVDEAAHAVFATDADGNPLRDSHNHLVSFGAAQLKKPMGIAVGQDAVYVGDNELHRILKFSTTGYTFMGEAVGYEGSIAALALDAEGNLLVHTGSDAAPIRLRTDAGYGTKGVLWSEAISISAAGSEWHRVQAQCEELAANVHLRLFFHTSDDPNDRPSIDVDADNPFSDSKWKPSATTPDPFADTHDLFIGGPRSRYLWLGALFLGDGRSTPIVPQILLEFDHEGYLNDLPALYQTEPDSRDFLLRFLALTETLFQDLENKIGGLPILFDPYAVPKEFLSWLATWLAVDLDENWSEEQQRRLVASAFERYSRRGTVAGLRESLGLLAGVNGIIQEPILNAAWWSLPLPAATCGCHRASSGSEAADWQGAANSVLGATTMLAAAHPQGAVLGSTATLDYSNLITNEEFGSPLFESVAHQFTVQIYRSDLSCPETMARVRAVLDREKPAHTDYHLCTIEARMRVGFQARLGIDAVVGGSREDIRLGSAKLDGDAVIGGEAVGRIGTQSRIGIGTRIG